MANRTPEAVEALINRFDELGQTIKQAQKERAAIVGKLGAGRHEGITRAIRVTGANLYKRLDVKKIREFVSAAVLERCMVNYTSNGSARIVPKAKPRKTK